jgi:predicted PurR-regulated permease PerM
MCVDFPQPAMKTTGTFVLALLTALLFYATWRMTEPFLAGLTWGFTLAVACAPLRRRLFRRMNRTAATVLIEIVAIVLIAITLGFLGRELFAESAALTQKLAPRLSASHLQDSLQQQPGLARLLNQIDEVLDLDDLGLQALQTAAGWIGPAVLQSFGFLTQTGVALLAFYFFLRDEEALMKSLQRLLPLPHEQAAHLFDRVATTVRAAVWGRLFIGCIQGALGGVMFALLGLPSAVLWAAAMSLLSIIPMLGSFVVWIPAAVWLLATGHWVKAMMLAVWGIAVINPVDNVLYPVLVGTRVGLHPLLLFIGFVGGLAVFGPCGLVLGPCIIALASGMAEVWRMRAETEVTL